MRTNIEVSPTLVLNPGKHEQVAVLFDTNWLVPVLRRDILNFEMEMRFSVCQTKLSSFYVDLIW